MLNGPQTSDAPCGGWKETGLLRVMDSMPANNEYDLKH